MFKMKVMLMIVLVCVLLVACFAAPLFAMSRKTDGITLAIDGKAACTIVIPTKPLEMERFAAEELAR